MREDFYRECTIGFHQSAFDLRREYLRSDRLLSRIRWAEYSHGKVSTISDVGGGIQQSEMKEKAIPFELEPDVLEAGKAEEVDAALKESFTKLRDEMIRDLGWTPIVGPRSAKL